jgi:hypothetical protein
MSTATAVRAPLTRPQKSQRILEGTTSFVTTVLVLWLLLWFAGRGPHKASVQAYHVPGYDVPYLEADVQGLAGPSATVLAATFDELGDKLVSHVTKPSGQAVVLAVSAPMIGDSEKVKPDALIRKIAENAQRDVLIVLDLAQVDSDRELGVFGNAPYLGLETALSNVKPLKANINVAVLCSCEPGQKSWAADGLGRSVFSYFVQRGLAGAAWGTGDPGGGHRATSAAGDRTPSALADYVRRQVFTWVSNERKAKQTPVLIPVGPSKVDFRLPNLALMEPAELARKEKEAAETKEAADRKTADKKATDKKDVPEKKEPPPDPRKTRLDELLTAWEKHDALAAGRVDTPHNGQKTETTASGATAAAPRSADRPATPVYRLLPTAWHSYETKLLRAERAVRAFCTDLAAGDHDAEDSLRAASEAHDELQRLLKERRDQNDPGKAYRPVRTDAQDSDAEVVLNRALMYVTGRFSSMLKEPTRPQVAPKPATAATAKAETRTAAVAEADPSSNEPPDELREAYGHQPATHLELQLPLWAWQFHEAFGRNVFRDDPERGKRLRLAVEKRLDAETALAVDRRGLDWFETLIISGDTDRRKAQDDLFGAGGEQALKTLETRFIAYGRTYAQALERIKMYRQSRELLEEIAAELPFLGEWQVLDEAQAPPTTGPELPGPLEQVIKTAFKLAGVLDDGHASEEARRGVAFQTLAGTHQNALKAFRALQAALNDRAEFSRDNPGRDDWREIDAVLRCPSIRHDVRKELLRRVVSRDPSPVDTTSKERPGGGADPVFLRRAQGLAWFEKERHGLASSRSLPGNPVQELQDHIEKLAAVAPSAGEPSADSDATVLLKEFRDLTVEVAKLRRYSPPLPPDPGQQGHDDRSEAKVGGLLRGADRDVRFRPVGPLGNTKRDDAIGDLDQFSARQTQLFQAQRLAEDYARAREVEDVRNDAVNLYKRADHDPTQEKTYAGQLAPDPRSPIAIDPSSQTAALEVGVQLRSPEGGVNDATVPEGQAFVGVLPTPSPDKKSQLVVSTGSLAATGLVGTLVEVGKGAVKTAKVPFVVRQQTNAAPGTTEKLLAAVFYRGRVEPENQSPGQVTVTLATFGPAVTIEIAQSEKAFKDKYPGDKFHFSDQFLVGSYHREGYFHHNGQLDFVLKFTNNKAERLSVRIDRTWMPLAGEGKPTELKPVVVDIEPKHTFEIADFVDANRVKDNQPMKLVVKVSHDKDPLDGQDFTFENLKPERYLTFEVKKSRDRVPPNPVEVDTVRVYVWRRLDDPVTDPILYRDIEFEFKGRPPDSNELDVGGFLHHGKYVYGCEELSASGGKIPYRVIVEKMEVLKAEY